ncbi:hypothetical protein C7121_07120 [Paenibacillus glucanolyticus]|jgi:hypothetical protein|uniref:hypothetical protein n=1 Tax=Paenibacillus TaxID=44249 RepID=UPI0003E264A0|nr:MULTISPECIES: hypothetical protein [Paenibacillus]ANA80053.1 hypothetical protein A3958_08700 [Paenibacillus glucanolyticus]AVV55922.1 hypothetical protein C7121_07120 [Paenibacillus glucanolyticus]ETT38443.1 hypothetical protein C169_12552 [Paenibacillus sp. FSL R5-808]MPY19274.1 hypothetical protein [Paenibacillus glucanolyticus]
MSLQYPGHQEQTLYQAEPNMRDSIQSVRDHIHHLCKQYANQLVRVETLDGDVFEGTIIRCDRGILYLSLPDYNHQRGFGPSYYNHVILPLVLFELLVITLLYT